MPGTVQEAELTEMHLGSSQAEAEAGERERERERHYKINYIICGKCHG